MVRIHAFVTIDVKLQIIYITTDTMWESNKSCEVYSVGIHHHI